MSFRERLRVDPVAGTIHDGEIRYIMIRPDALMGIFARLAPAARNEALDAFKDSIIERGGHSAAGYVERNGRAALLDVIEETAAELGWGRWRFTRSENVLELIVENSPFAEGASFPGPVCHPIVAMGEVVAGLVLGGPVTARETECAATSGTICAFRMELIPS